MNNCIRKTHGVLMNKTCLPTKPSYQDTNYKTEKEQTIRAIKIMEIIA